jgi:hypothetical protein
LSERVKKQTLFTWKGDEIFMTRIAPDGGGGDPNGYIKVVPGVWALSAQTISTNNNSSQDIQAAVMTTVNGLIDTLNVFTYVQGAVDLAKAVSEFGDGIENMLGCVAVDLAVIGSGLAAAAKAFGNLDGSLVTMFSGLNTDLGYYTTTSTLSSTIASTYSAYHIPKPSGGGGGFSFGHFFGHVWHDVTNWGSDIYHAVDSGLQDIGVPACVAVGVAGGVVVLYYAAAGTATVAAAG